MQSGLQGVSEFAELLDETQGGGLDSFVAAAEEPADAAQTTYVAFVVLVVLRHWLE